MQTFGQFELIKKLATGGMAEVWLARQKGIEGFNRHVVVKRILPHLAEDPEFIQMFLNEAKIAARFSHPNIGQIFDLGESGGQFFIAMEYIRGEDLGRVMRRAWTKGQWVGRPAALRIIADACSALYYAHTRTDEQGRALKVVHRDISPQNIIVSFDGSVKLVDFGIAKAVDQRSLTKSGAIKGKFAYMSPEQAAGKALDSRSDIYALGLVLYELITGVRPIKRDSEVATLRAAMEADIRAPSEEAEVPQAMDELVMRALAKRPEDRYPDARRFQLALEQQLVLEGTIATSVQVSELMELLFDDRLKEEARSGQPSPLSDSSVSNPGASDSKGRSSASSSGKASQASRPAKKSEETAWAREEAEPDGEDEDEEDEADEEAAEGDGRRRAREDDDAGEDPDDVEADDERDAPEVTAREPRRAVKRSKEKEKQRPAERGLEKREGRPSVRGGARSGNPASDGGRSASGRNLQRSGRRSSGSSVPSSGPGKRPTPAPSSIVTTSGNGPPRWLAGLLESAKQKVNANLPAPPQRLRDFNPGPLDVTSLRQRASVRLQWGGIAVGVLGLVIIALVLRESACGSAAGVVEAIPVQLSVFSRPRTTVRVVPPPGTKQRKPVVLGQTPLDSVSGAFANDVIELTDSDRGLRYEQVVMAAMPGEQVRIEKTFREGTLKVFTRPAAPQATLWKEGELVGKIGVPIKLYEGRHHLEIRADALSQPVEFEVEISPGEIQVKDVSLPGGPN